MEETAIDKLNRVYEKLKDKFSAGFHDTLWQLLINKAFESVPKKCFVFVYHHGYPHLGIAHGVDGYSPTTSYFKDDITFDEGTDICEELNKEIFNINPDEAFKIYAKSTWLESAQRN